LGRMAGKTSLGFHERLRTPLANASSIGMRLRSTISIP